MKNRHAGEISDKEYRQICVEFVEVLESHGIQCVGCMADVLEYAAVEVQQYITLTAPGASKSKSKLH